MTADKQEHSNFLTQAQEAFEESILVKQQIIKDHLETLTEIAFVIADKIEKGGCLYLCGNGGSLADAQHLAAEMLVRLRPHVNRRSLPALCLATDMSSVTACGNDYSFEEIFSRSLEGLGKENDIILGITTSGNSKNIIRAFEKAKEMNIETVGFLGCDGGPAAEFCHYKFIVPSHTTARIQESHITAGHVVMEMIEDILYKKGHISIA